jgi:hypothetical protein
MTKHEGHLKTSFGRLLKEKGRDEVIKKKVFGDAPYLYTTT